MKKALWIALLLCACCFLWTAAAESDADWDIPQTLTEERWEELRVRIRDVKTSNWKKFSVFYTRGMSLRERLQSDDPADWAEFRDIFYNASLEGAEWANDLLSALDALAVTGDRSALDAKLNAYAGDPSLTALLDGKSYQLKQISGSQLNTVREVLESIGYSREEALLDQGAETAKADPLWIVALPDGTATVVRYSGQEAEVAVPAEYESCPVTRIGKAAFAGRVSLQSVSLPGTLTEIGEAAFANCGLTSVTIPQGITEIPEMAFIGCMGLEELNLPEGLTVIGPYAFAACRSLVELHIPDSVQRIEEGAFTQGGPKIARLVNAFATDGAVVVVPPGHFDALSLGSGVQYIGDWAFAAHPADEIVFPDSVIEIGAYTFAGNEFSGLLDTVTLPEGLQRLGEGAFSNNSITAVTLPNSLTQVDANPFIGCDSLREIIVSPDHPTLQSVDGVLFSKDGKRLISYPLAHNTEEYAVPDGTEVLGAYAFAAYSSGLDRIILPASLTSIDYYALRPMYIGTAYVPAGSYAEGYCAENAIPYQVQ